MRCALATENLVLEPALYSDQEYEWQDELPMVKLEQTETYSDVTVSTDLGDREKRKAEQMVEEFQDVFSYMPGKTDLVECHQDTTSSRVVSARQCPLPFAVRKVITEEVQNMMNLGIVEQSNSAYNSPVLVIKKPDDTHRFCVDFRKLNEVVTKVCRTHSPSGYSLRGRWSGKMFLKARLFKGVLADTFIQRIQGEDGVALLK